MLYMLTAGKKALVDGGITEDIMKELNKTRCGVLIGSAMGGMKVEYLDSVRHMHQLLIVPLHLVVFYN